MQLPTRNDTIGSGSTNSQPTTAPSNPQTTRTTQQVSSPSVPSVPTGMYPGYSFRSYTYDFELSFPFAWNTVAGATSYQIAARDLTNGSIAFESTVRGNRITPATPFTAGREYVWDVAACNAAGCSARSRGTYFKTAGGSSQTQQATRSRPSDAGNWSSNFARDAFDAAGDGTQKCAIALAQQTGESLESAYQLVTNVGGWQAVANGVARSVGDMVRNPILAAQNAWNGFTGQISGVQQAIVNGDPSLACQRAVQLSGTVISTVGGAQAVGSGLSSLRRVVSNGREVTESAVARVPRQTQTNDVRSVAATSVVKSRGVWAIIDTTLRGNIIHKALGQNTPDGFPAVDLWNANSGHAVSIKSMDTAISYQTASGFRNALNTHINQIANFQKGRLEWLEIKEGQVRSRELLIAIPPEGLNAVQQQVLATMRGIAADKNVSIRLVTYGD